MDQPRDPKSHIKSSTSNSVPIRISKLAARKLRSLVTKCNKKSYGRKVKADDVICQALDLLQDYNLEAIKQSTYSSQDQIEIEYKKFCQQHGSLSKDEFLKMLLRKALPRDSTGASEEGKARFLSE